MVSIVYVHWAMNEFRSELMRRSITTLVETAGDQQILVADNGGNIEDSKFLLELCEQGKIAVYLRFRVNVHFAYARNQLLRMATEPYIAIVDNDIIFEKGWWQECVEYLSKNEKTTATPLVPDISHRKVKYWNGEQGGWQLNWRAGSSCFVMTRKCFEEVGYFQLHNVAGSKYADALNRAGYRMAVMPQCKAIDLGERNGYNWREPNYSHTL